MKLYQRSERKMKIKNAEQEKRKKIIISKKNKGKVREDKYRNHELWTTRRLFLLSWASFHFGSLIWKRHSSRNRLVICLIVCLCPLFLLSKISEILGLFLFFFFIIEIPNIILFFFNIFMPDLFLEFNELFS